MRLEGVLQGGGGKDLITGQSAHTASTIANGLLLDGRDAAPVATDRAGLAAVVVLGELAGRGEIEGGKCARLSEEMT